MKKSTDRITSAHLMSAVALVVALGAGTSVAAGKVHLPANSVKSKTIKDGQVRSADLAAAAVSGSHLADSSVTSSKIADGSVGAADLQSGVIPGSAKPRAYGVVAEDGTIVSSRSHGATVSLTAGSDYCVTPTPDTGIDPRTTTIVATPDVGGSPTTVQLADSVNPVQNPSCPGGFLLVVQFWTGTTFSPGARAFSFVIP